MNIGILQTGHLAAEMQPDFGDYAAMFAALLSRYDFSFTTYNVVDGVFPLGPDAQQGWIITGSRHGVYEDHAWLTPLEDLVRAIKAAQVPLIGVCFGHQLIAQALGGTVEKSDYGWIIGRQTYDFGGTELALNAWHQDQVRKLPDGAIITAKGTGCPIAGFRIGQDVLCYQAHPEFDAAVLAGLLTHRGGAVPPPLVETARNTLNEGNDAALIGEEMAEFLQRGAP